ncbi:GtrA family protein [Granulosicoccaceae sp. 1_MG-2023]|nr:GtrA family protein [Granulosicoccaceae sp. 1_MG-2023]
MIELAKTAFLRTDILLRYMVGGGIGAVTQFATLWLLHDVAGMNATVSSSVGFIAALIVNYLYQYHVTFRADSAHPLTFSRFALVGLSGLLVNSAVFWLLHSSFGLHYLLSQFFATGTVFFSNYVLNYHFAFQNGAHHEEADPA